MLEQDPPKQESTDDEESADKGRVKLKKLNVNRETIQELTDDEIKRVQGGRAVESVAGTDPVPFSE